MEALVSVLCCVPEVARGVHVTWRQMGMGAAAVFGMAVLSGYEAHGGHEWNALVFGLGAVACFVSGLWALEGA